LYDRYFFKGASEKQSPGPEIDKLAAKPSLPVPPVERVRSGQPRSRFSNTLGEQLQGKTLDFFNVERQDKQDE
jgi:hypothetical protein